MLLIRGIRRKDNCIEMDNKYIFLGINDTNVTNISDNIPSMNNRKIHIFAYKLSHVKYIREFVSVCDVDGKYRPKIIIHIPRSVKELKDCIDERLIGCREYTIQTEKTGITFSNYWVDFLIKFEGDSIQTWVNPKPGWRSSDSAYEYTPKQDDRPSITFEVLLKKELIRAFKDSCSKSLLNQIGNDDEKIWKFIEQQNWRVNIDNK